MQANDSEVNRIELVGTITGKYALAILRIDKKTEGIYQLNQKVLGYSITAVSKDAIVLTRNSKSHSLSLIASKPRHYYGGSEHTNSNTAMIPSYKYRIHRNTLLSLQHDKQLWLDNLRFKLILDDGYLAGYQLTYIRTNSPAALLGLSKGDIITGINGISIRHNNVEFIKIISELQNSQHFTLNMRHSETAFKIEFIIEENE